MRNAAPCVVPGRPRSSPVVSGRLQAELARVRGQECPFRRRPWGWASRMERKHRRSATDAPSRCVCPPGGRTFARWAALNGMRAPCSVRRAGVPCETPQCAEPKQIASKENAVSRENVPRAAQTAAADHPNRVEQRWAAGVGRQNGRPGDPNRASAAILRSQGRSPDQRDSTRIVGN